MMLRLGHPKGITFSGPLSYSQTLKEHTTWYKQMWIIVDIAKDLDFIIKTKTIQKIIQSHKDKYCMISLLWGISNSQSYRKQRIEWQLPRTEAKEMGSCYSMCFNYTRWIHSIDLMYTIVPTDNIILYT